MRADEGSPARLRDLHDAYVWEVNAAIGEGREDLIGPLVDGYLEAAVAAMAEEFPSPCDRAGCPMCGGAAPVRSGGGHGRPRAWWRRLSRG